MEINSIKNERDYQKALKELDRLMDARQNTAEGDRLDVLVTLAEAWEKKHWQSTRLIRSRLEILGSFH